MLTIIHGADFHLAAPFAALPPDKARARRAEQRELLDRLAADPAFGLTRPELEALMDPRRYIGRCPQQVARFLERCQPLLTQAQTADGTIPR